MTETLKEKLDLLNLSEDERTKLEEKFIASLSYVSIDEMKAVLDVLAKKGAKITRAREVKVLANSANKIEKNYSFVEEAHEPGIYSDDLNRLSGNGVDIFKRIRYCNQYDIPYKNEDGTYKDFIFNESLFQQEVNGPTPTMDTSDEEKSLIDEEPVEVEVPEVEMTDDNVESEEQQEVNDYMQAETDLDDIESQTTTFAQIKQDLEAQLAELDALRSQNEYENNDNVFRFNDIEQETYNVGRGR